MALPLLLGLAGSGLAGAGMLGGMSALTAGALGSGLGSLAQGDDLETAIGTGMLSYLGGKALGSFGKDAATAASGATPTAQMAADPMLAGSNIPTELTTGALSGGAKATGIPGAFSALKNPTTLGALGTTGLVEASKPPKMDFDKDEYPDIPEAEAAKRRMRAIDPNYRPGFDPEFNYFQPFQEGGEVSKPNDKEIINKAVDAIKGIDPEPERSLALFVSTYGEEALKDLVERVRSGQFDDNAEVSEGMVEGIGDGMDDMIPATLEGEQDVVLSDGEFIVPADVVSGLGNGSTDAGADSLYEMMDRVRQMRTGKSEQPEQVPQGMMLPV